MIFASVSLIFLFIIKIGTGTYFFVIVYAKTKRETKRQVICPSQLECVKI